MMKKTFPMLVALLPMCVIADPFAELVRPTGPLTAEEEATKFRLLPGFTIKLIASEPAVNKPMNMAFDVLGRLWVTSSAEYPWAIRKEAWKTPEGLLESSRDKILVFSDSNGDGIVDKPTTFVDNLNIPTGVLPYGKGCIAWSIPNIWYFADNDGDGKCDERKILFGPLGWEKDTHGNLSSFRLAEDGWVYATHGFSNVTHIAVRPENGGKPPTKPTPSAENWPLGEANLDFGNSLDLQSGNVFRFKPDGSRVEPWAWGQVNPFGLTFDSHGNMYTADCHSNPLTQVIRGAYYPSFGKPHDGLGYGPVLCEHSHGSTGICGPLYLHSGVWGSDFDDNLLICNPVTSRINRDKVTFTGATPQANELQDFLSTEDPWFRPVDIQLGPDGALYVADFYNKIIGHYEVPLTHPGRDKERGRLWRIAKEGVTKRPAYVRQNLPKGQGFGHRQGEIQCREALEPSMLASLVQSLAKCPENDPTQRHFLKINIRALLQRPGGFQALAGLRSDASLAEIIRTLRTPEAAAWMLGYLQLNPGDKASLKKALTPLARVFPAEGEPKLASFVKEQFSDDLGAQVELFQAMHQGILQRGAPTEATLAWGGEIVEKLLVQLDAQADPDWSCVGKPFWKLETRPAADGQEIPVLTSLPAPRSKEMEHHTGSLLSRAFACPERLSFWLCGHRGHASLTIHEKTFVRLLDAATGQELAKALPPGNDTAQQVVWELKPQAGKSVRLEVTDGDAGDAYAWLAIGRLEPAVVALGLPGGGQLQVATEMVRELKLEPLADRLAKYFDRDSVDDSTRSALAQAMASFSSKQSLVLNLLKTSPGKYHSLLAESLAGSLAGAKKLAEEANPRLLTLPAVSKKIASLGNADLNALVASKTANLPPASETAAKVIKERMAEFLTASGDVAAGQQVFATHCAVCHKVGNLGNVVGPQLDGAGNRGLERLCEDILDPNKDVDPAFHLRILTLKDGSVQAGLQRRLEGETIVLADATARETLISKSSLAKEESVPMSLMPAAFAESIPKADFNNLLAWLLSLRQP